MFERYYEASHVSKHRRASPVAQEGNRSPWRHWDASATRPMPLSRLCSSAAQNNACMHSRCWTFPGQQKERCLAVDCKPTSYRQVHKHLQEGATASWKSFGFPRPGTAHVTNFKAGLRSEDNCLLAILFRRFLPKSDSDCAKGLFQCISLYV